MPTTRSIAAPGLGPWRPWPPTTRGAPHLELGGLHGERPVDIPLLVLVDANGGVCALAVDALNRAHDLGARGGTESAGTACATWCLRRRGALPTGWCRATTPCSTCRLPCGQQAEIFTGNGVLVLLPEVFPGIQHLNVAGQLIPVLPGIQDQSPGVLVTSEYELFLLTAEGLLAPGGQQRRHANGHHRHHDEEHDHREAAGVQSRARPNRQASDVSVTLTA